MHEHERIIDMAISRTAFDKLQARYDNLKTRYPEAVKKGMHFASVIVEDMEALTMGGLLGVIEGRYGELKLGPVPMELIVSGLFHTAGFVLGGKVEDHLHTFGRSATTVAGYKQGVFVGDSWKKAAVPGGDDTKKLP